jgi:hypothetical protein
MEEGITDGGAMAIQCTAIRAIDGRNVALNNSFQI